MREDRLHVPAPQVVQSFSKKENQLVLTSWVRYRRRMLVLRNWDGEHESAAFAEFALHPDFSLMLFDKSLADRKA